MTFGTTCASTSCSARRGSSCATSPPRRKTLVQTVPETYRDDTLLDVIAFLRATVRGVDSSLIDEWSACATSQARAVDARASLAETLGPPPVWPTRAFAARIRNELHALFVALARKDAAAALAALAPGGD